MPNTDTTQQQGFDDTDDDIVDLLEVVKPGKPGKPAAPATDDVDFSADLDAMLASLSQAEQALDANGDPQFPDPTPVDHAVDHNETLAMPSMDDLDSLLETLGADKIPDEQETEEEDIGAETPPAQDLDALPVTEAKLPAPAVQPEASPARPESGTPLSTEDIRMTEQAIDAVLEATFPSEPGHSGSADAKGSPVVDFDAVFEAARQASPKGAAPTAFPPAAAPKATVDTMPEPEDPFEAALAAGAAKTKSAQAEPAPAPAAATDLAGDVLPGETAPAADASLAEEEEPAPLDGGTRYDEVDLNELDALLDDMLAAAPVSGPAPAAADSAAAPLPTPAESAGTAVQATSLAALQQELDVRMREVQALREELAAQADAMRALRDAAQTLQTEAAAHTEAAQSLRAELASLADEVQALRTELVAGTDATQALQEELAARSDEVQILQDQLAAQDKDVRELRDDLALFRDNLDKVAAEAAAKVIREEIAALLQSM